MGKTASKNADPSAPGEQIQKVCDRMSSEIYSVFKAVPQNGLTVRSIEKQIEKDINVILRTGMKEILRIGANEVAGDIGAEIILSNIKQKKDEVESEDNAIDDIAFRWETYHNTRFRED